MSDLLLVTERIDGAHPMHTTYPLLPGDVLTLSEDGTYVKHTGICVCGFLLTDGQAATLKPTGGEIVLTSWGDPDLFGGAAA